MMLCIAGLMFPFSVAVTNIALGVALAAGMVSGLWWQGSKSCWQCHRLFTVLFTSYFALLLLGLLWSSDLQWGLHILGRHWFWLLIPIVVVSLSEKKWRNYFLISLSTGLTLNLFFCVLQAFEVVHVAVGGSGADNPTGHIGHIGFGFVYGIWAACLVWLGGYSNGRIRWLCWSLAAWAYIMVFLAQGRSGYVVAFMLAVALIPKYLALRGSWKQLLPIALAASSVIVLVLAFGPAKERLQGTWDAITGERLSLHTAESSKAEIANVSAAVRIDLWRAGLNIYFDNLLLGVGTGGWPSAVSTLEDKNLTTLPAAYAHPHNQYILAMARWGTVGILLFLTLLYVWMREGWRRNWQEDLVAPLVFLPALALAVHGLTSSSFEEHFSAILAGLLLGVGLAGSSSCHKKEESS